ncbi:hypothetical protein GIB67_018296 [Kingdonia uniflora]|uniref:Uncharacterized protein n=1 Tax=Kingdonia uniflora TaxID=39325 RepID=A0A7J7LAA4_9MAGN|nr:hypothetical protein GIB67_018296 [Kingdonia uniflora]
MFGDALQSQFTLNMPKNLAASKIAAWTTNRVGFVNTGCGTYSTILWFCSSIDWIFICNACGFDLSCACYLRIHRGILSWSEIGVCNFIIIVGVMCSCIGSYSAVSRIANEMSS